MKPFTYILSFLFRMEGGTLSEHPRKAGDQTQKTKDQSLGGYLKFRISESTYINGVVSVRFPGSQVAKHRNKNKIPQKQIYVELYAPRHRDLHKKLYFYFLRFMIWTRKSRLPTNIPKQIRCSIETDRFY